MAAKFWLNWMSNCILLTVATLIVLIQTQYVCMSFAKCKEDGSMRATDIDVCTAIVTPRCCRPRHLLHRQVFCQFLIL